MSLIPVDDLEKVYYSVRKAVRLARTLQGHYGQVEINQYSADDRKGGILYTLKIYTHCNNPDCDNEIIVVYEDHITFPNTEEE